MMAYKDKDYYTLDDMQDMHFALDLRDEIERREKQKQNSQRASK